MSGVHSWWEPDNDQTLGMVLVGKTMHVGPLQNGLVLGLLRHYRGEGRKEETIGLCRDNVHSTGFIPRHPVPCARPSLALCMDFLIELSRQPYGLSTGFTPSV